jgi:hypothetical protein
MKNERYLLLTFDEDELSEEASKDLEGKVDKAICQEFGLDSGVGFDVREI